jgi:hypothetical protein
MEGGASPTPVFLSFLRYYSNYMCSEDLARLSAFMRLLSSITSPMEGMETLTPDYYVMYLLQDFSRYEDTAVLVSMCRGSRVELHPSQWPRLLRQWVLGSNPTRGKDVCISSVFLLQWVGSGLAVGLSPS